MKDFENLSKQDGEKLVNGNSIYLEADKIERNELLVTNDNDGFFYDKKIGDKISRQNFYFSKWTINFNNTSNKIVVEPCILSLYDNGHYTLTFPYSSGLYGRKRPYAQLFLNIKFRKWEYTLQATRAKWPVSCGNHSHEFSGNISKDNYDQVTGITLQVDGSLFNCR